MAWLAAATLGLGVPSCRCGSDAGELRQPAGPGAGEPPSATAPSGEPHAVPSAASWPAWPQDGAALEDLRVRHYRREAAPIGEPGAQLGPHPTAEAILALLRAREHEGAVLAGWPTIVDWFQSRLDAARAARRPSYILWGVYHDSSEQVASFGQLVGPLGLGGPLGVAVELFESDGAWSGIPPEAQRGDDALLSRYLGGGDPDLLEELARRQQRVDYTAWKYGYVPTVIDLVVRARASGRTLIGCNMPGKLQERARAVLGERTDALRELHCALALRDAFERAPSPAPIAVLWGQSHLAPGGFERLLPAQADVLSVRVFGARPNDTALEQPLGDKLALTDPVLFAADEGPPGTTVRLILLLPSGALAASVDRVRRSQGCPLPDDQQRRLRLSSLEPGKVRIDGAAEVELGSQPRSLVLAAGAHGYFFDGAPLALGGAIDMPEAGQLELELQPAARSVLDSTLDCSSPSSVPMDEP